MHNKLPTTAIDWAERTGILSDSSLGKYLLAHKRLEAEPQLYCRSEVIDCMKKAITLSQMGGYKESDLEVLLFK